MQVLLPGARIAAICPAAHLDVQRCWPPYLPPVQALVAWSLQRSFPGQAVSLVAEEDAVELRAPEGADMLARIAALVNEALAVEHPQVGGRGCSCWLLMLGGRVMAVVGRRHSHNACAVSHQSAWCVHLHSPAPPQPSHHASCPACAGGTPQPQ